MKNPSILTADQVDKATLDAFLCSVYLKPKAEFLSANAEWWHRGDENRWVLVAGDQSCTERNRAVAGYCAVIPTRVLITGEEIQAMWWVDLVIDPAFRGRGFQSLFDNKIRNLPILKLGFPNKLAAKIHAKHGWGVRNNLQVVLLPLHPLHLNRVRRARGLKGAAMRLAALALTPIARVARWRLSHYQPKCARLISDPDPQMLANIFMHYHLPEITTTLRDAAHFRWRYLESPYRSELSFYIAGPSEAPTHYLITRRLTVHGATVTRILDVFGDFDDLCTLNDLLRCALRDAVISDSVQVTTLISQPILLPVFRKLGFLIRSVARFCWCTESINFYQTFTDSSHWVLADSDNDSII